MTYGPDLVEFGKQFIGTPYVWGGEDLNSGVDCSGLTQQIYAQYGIEIPRTSYDQYGVGQSVGLKGLKPGDLVFFDTDPGTRGPDHVGIYMGDGKMLHAPRPGKSVEIADMTSGYYMDRFLGGKRLDGVKNSGTASSDFEEPKMTKEELAANYGWSYAFLNSVPEIQDLVEQAIDETWEPNKFQAELMESEWWKSHSESMRKAEVMKATDPATYQAEVEAAKIHVTQMAAQMGAPILDAQAKKMAERVVKFGLTDEQITDTLGKYIDFTENGTLLGAAGMYQFKVKQYAADMGITLSDETIKNQAARIGRKLATEEDFQNEIKEQAKSMYPSYTDAIDGGSTVRDIASPYMQIMSQELEIPEGSIQLGDPIIKNALNGLGADKKPTGMGLADFQMRLRNDPRWAKTQGAQNSALAVGLKILSDMGFASSSAGSNTDQRSMISLPDD